jgi:hypothetical protein
MWTSGEAAHCTLRCVGMPCGLGATAQLGESEAMRLRVEVERTGMFGLGAVASEAACLGGGDDEGAGRVGCQWYVCGRGALMVAVHLCVWLKALSTASQDCLGLVVAQNI